MDGLSISVKWTLHCEKAKRRDQDIITFVRIKGMLFLACQYEWYREGHGEKDVN